MIDPVERLRRKECLRKWYFGHSEMRTRSVVRGLVTRRLSISHYQFYMMLIGRAYVNNYRAKGINEVINKGCIPGLEADIFAKENTPSPTQTTEYTAK